MPVWNRSEKAMLLRNFGLLCALLIPGMLGGCPTPPVGDSANENTSAIESNTNGVTDVQPVNQNSSDSVNDNQNAGLDQAENHNQNATQGNNGNLNAPQNSNANQNPVENQNSNGGGHLLRNEDRAAIDAFVPALKHAMKIPALLQSYAVPLNLDFDSLPTNPPLGTMGTCPSVAWVVDATRARVGLVFDDPLLPPCLAPTVDAQLVTGETEIVSFDRALQEGVVTARFLTIAQEPATLSGTVHVTGGGADPVSMEGRLFFAVGDVSLEGQLALQLERAGAITLNGPAATIRNPEATYTVSLEDLRLSVITSGSLAPVAGAVVLQRQAGPPMRISFSPASASDGTITVQVGDDPPVTIDVASLAG